jgi:hypothetical protein
LYVLLGVERIVVEVCKWVVAVGERQTIDEPSPSVVGMVWVVIIEVRNRWSVKRNLLVRHLRGLLCEVVEFSLPLSYSLVMSDATIPRAEMIPEASRDKVTTAMGTDVEITLWLFIIVGMTGVGI